jgi:hypothetical protein
MSGWHDAADVVWQAPVRVGQVISQDCTFSWCAGAWFLQTLLESWMTDCGASATIVIE